MRWQDEGIVIWRSPFGESRMTVWFLTQSHGLHAGLVRCGRNGAPGATGGRSELQVGNLMDINWSARLAEHLGNYQVQMKRAYASSVLQCGQGALLALNSLAGLLKLSLAERMPLPGLYARTHALLQLLAEEAGRGDTWAQAYCLWELALLEELGYGLDMETCAMGGSVADLAFISPKSGRAASYEKAQDYENKLLKLPDFLKTQSVSDGTLRSDLYAGLKLTGFFLQSRILTPLGKPFPDERMRLAEVFV